MKQGLSKGLKWFYGIGDMFFVLMSNVQDFYFNFYLTNIAMFDLGIAAIIQTVITTVDAALSWIYGAIINGTKPMKWGRYRSWFIVTPWIVPFIYAFKFIKIGEATTAAIIICAAGIISSIVWNFQYVANIGIIAVAGKTAEDRIALASNRGTYNRVAGILFAYAGLPFAGILALIVGEQYKFAALAFIFGALCAFGYYIHFRLFKGYEQLPTQSDVTEDTEDTEKKTVQKKKERTSFSVMLKSLFTNLPLCSLLVAEVGRWIVNFVVAGCAVYYFTYVIQNVALLAGYLLATNIACVVGAYTCKFVANKFSVRTTFIAYLFIMGATMLLARMFYMNVLVVIIGMTITQYCYGSVYSLATAMFADTIIYAEWKTGENSSGWIMGLSVVPLKIALILRGLIINGALAAAGFSASIDPSQITESVKVGISNAFLLIPSIFVLVGGLLLLFLFRLKKEQVEQMSLEIAARG